MDQTSQRMMMGAAGKKPPPEFSYVASTLGQELTTSRTFTSFGIGSADAARRVIVLVNFSASPPTTLSSVTVGGQATSIVSSVSNSGSVAAICITDNPITSGSTADIVVNTNDNAFQMGIATYRAVNLDSTTPTATETATASGQSRSLSVLTGGCIIGNGGNMGFNGDTGDRISWTNLTRNYHINGYDIGIGHRTSGAFFVSSSDQTRSVTCNMTDEFRPVVCYASFR